jgi:hypothetical protein
MELIRGGLVSALVAGLACLSWYGARNDVRRMERAGVDPKQSTIPIERRLSRFTAIGFGALSIVMLVVGSAELLLGWIM